MAAPGTIGNLVAPGEDNTNRKIADLERALKELAPSVMETILPLITDLQAQQAELDAQQDAIEAQQAEILALVNTQIVPEFGYASGSGYALPVGAGTTRATFNLVVPAGYTQALISATAQDSGVNSTAGFDYLVSYVEIDAPSGYWAYSSSATVPAGYTGASLASMTALLTGLTGGQVIAVVSQPYTFAGAWAANAANTTILSGTCMFLR